MVTERTYKLDSDGDEHLMSTKVVSPEVRKDSKSKRVKPLSLDKEKDERARTSTHQRNKEEKVSEVGESREKGKAVRSIKKKTRDVVLQSVLRKVERAKDGRELGVIEEVFRKPIEPVSWKFVKKVVAQPDGTTKEIEEPEYVLPDDAKETVDEVKDKKGKVLKRVIVKPVPMITGRKIFRTVIVSPTGAELKCTEDIEDTDQPLEEKPLGEKPSEGKPSGEKPLGEKPSEEKPLGEKPSEGKLLDEKPSEEIIREPHPMDDSVEQIPDEYPRFIIRGGRKFHAVSSTAPEKPSPVTAEQIHRKPKHVERLYTTLLLRPLSGEDRVLETSEAVLSLEPEEESPGTTEDVKDKRGSLVKKVSTTPMYVSRQKTLVKKSVLMPDGHQHPKSTVVIASDEPKESQALVLKRTVKTKAIDSEGKETVLEETKELKPYHLRQIKYLPDHEVSDASEHGRPVRIVKRKATDVVQKKAVERVAKKPDGKQDGPKEQLVIDPVEVTEYKFVPTTTRRPDGKEVVVEEPVYSLPEHAYSKPEEFKDDKGRIVRRITTVPLPVVTARKVYKLVILSPKGEELSVDERVEEQELPKEPEGEEVEETPVELFPALGKIGRATPSPDRKSPSPERPGKKSPAHERPSPEQKRKSPLQKSPEASRKASKTKSPDKRSKPEPVEEIVLPVTFTAEESMPEDMFESLPDSDFVMGKDETPKITEEERNDISKLMFPVEEVQDEPTPKRQLPKERSIATVFSRAVKKVTYMNYWQKLKENVDEKSALRPVEERIVRLGTTESRLKIIWEKLIEITEITIDYDSFILWLTFVERELTSLKPINSKYPVLEEQKSYHENLHKDLVAHVPVKEALERVTEELPEFIDSEPEREQVEQELNEITARFDRLYKMSEDRKKKIEEIEPLAKEHAHSVKPVEELNCEIEDVLKERPTGFVDLETLEDEMAVLKDMKDLISKDRPNVQKAKSTADQIHRFPNENIEKKPVVDNCDKALKNREEIDRSVDGRIATLEKQISKAKKFYMGVATIDTWAPQIDEVLEQDKMLAKDPEEIKEQLKKLDNLQKEIDEQRPTVDTVVDNGRWLCQNLYCVDSRGRRKSTANDVLEKMNSTTNTMDRLTDEISHRQRQLSLMLCSMEDFQNLIDKFDKWLKITEKGLDSQKTMPVTPQEVAKQIAKLDPLHKEVIQHEPVYVELMHNGQQQLDKLPAGREKEKLGKKLKEITDRWTKVDRIAKERSEKLSHLYPCVVDYHENMSVTEEVIKQGEAVLKTFEPFGLNSEAGRTQLHNIRATLDMFDRNEQAVVYLNQSVSDMERYVPDKSSQPLKKLARNNADKYSDVRRKLKEKEIAIERDLTEAEKFYTSFVTVEERVKKVEHLTSEVNDDAANPDEIKKQLDTVKEVLIIITEIITIIEVIEITISIKKKGKEPSSVMKELESKGAQIQSLKKRTDKVSEKAKDKQNNLVTRLEKESPDDLLSNTSIWLPLVEASVLRQTPVSADFHVLKSQEIEISILYQDVLSHEPIVKHVIESGKSEIKGKEPGPERDALTETIEDVEMRWNTVRDKITKRHAVVGKLYPTARKYSEEVEKLFPWMLTADKELRVIQPLSSQPEVLIQQKRAIEDLIKESEQKKPVLDKIKHSGHVLLDTSAHESRDYPIADREIVNEELKFLNQTWRTLTEKLSDVRKQADNIDKELVVFYDKERALEDLFEDVEHTIEKQSTVSTSPEKCLQEQHIIKALISKVDSRENDLKVFTRAGDNLHKLLDQYGSDDEDIERSKSDVNEKYRKVRAKLTERQAEFEQITGKAKQFNDVIKDTHKWIVNMTEKTEPKMKKAVPRDQKKIEEIITDIEATMVELVTSRVTLQNGANSGDWLIEKSRQDPMVVHEVTSRLKDVKKPVDDLSRKLSVYKTELENLLLQERDFSHIVENFDEKLDKIDGKFEKLRPVSAKYSVARSQHEDFKPIFREVQNLKKLHDAVVAKKKEIEEDHADSDKQLDDSVEKHLRRAGEQTNRWNEIWDSVTKYHLQITSVLPFEEAYHYTVLRFVPWLEDAEKKVKELHATPTTADGFDELKKKTKDLQDDIIEHMPTHQSFNTKVNDLLDICESSQVKVDVPHVKDEKHDLNERWDKLNKSRPVEEAIVAMENIVDEETPMSWDLLDMESHVRDLNENVESLQEHDNEVQDIVDAGKKVERIVEKQSGDTRDVRKKTGETSNKWKLVRSKLVDKRDKEENKLRQLVQYVSIVDDLDKWITVTTGTVSNLGPDGKEPETIAKQLEQNKVVEEELAKQQTKLETAEKAAIWLTDENKDNPKFVSNVNTKLSKIKKPLSEMSDIMSDRRKRLQATLLTLQDFDVICENYLTDINKIEKKQRAQKPISVQWEKVKKQLDEQKDVESEIETLKPVEEKFVELCKKSIDDPKTSEENKNVLKDQLNEATDHWQASLNKARMRREKLDEIKEPSKLFDEKEKVFDDWLTKAEKGVKSLDEVPEDRDTAHSVAKDND
eukprot:gene6649-7395_t